MFLIHIHADLYRLRHVHVYIRRYTYAAMQACNVCKILYAMYLCMHAMHARMRHALSTNATEHIGMCEVRLIVPEICMYVRMCKTRQIRTVLHFSVCTYVCMHDHMFACMYACIHVCMKHQETILLSSFPLLACLLDRLLWGC